MAKSLIVISAVLIVAFAAVCYFAISPESIQSSKLVEDINATPNRPAQREAKLLENTGLQEFDPANDIDDTVTDEEKKRDNEVLDAIEKGADLTDKEKLRQAIQEFDNLLKKYPDYGDLYFLRATYSLALGSTDYPSINSDLANALLYRSSKKYQSAYNSDAPIYILKAKVDALSGDKEGEINALQNAVHADPTSDMTTDFFGTGGTAPTSHYENPTALTLSDFNALVQAYPNDFRAYMLRGLFYASFATLDEKYNSFAIVDFEKAASLNPKAAEVDYLLGELYLRMTFWTTSAAADVSDMTGESGGYRDQMRNQALAAFNQAIAADPNYVYAYGGAAEANYELKNFPEAIDDYSKEIALDGKQAGAYNDRAEAEISIDQFTRAVADLTEAINLKKADTSKSAIEANLDLSYQSRADAYVKSGDFTSGIADYGRAIGVKFASELAIMSMDEIRGIYPELKNITDQDLLEGLRQKYQPNMTSTDFNSLIVKNKGANDAILSDLYSARGDAYLGSGDREKAFIEYARAMHNDPQYILKPDEKVVYDDPALAQYGW